MLSIIRLSVMMQNVIILNVGRYYILQNDIQYNDTKPKGLCGTLNIYDIQHVSLY